MPTLKFAKTQEQKDEEARAKRREEQRRAQEERERQYRAEQERRRAHEDARRQRDNAGYAARAAIQAQDKAMALEIINAGYKALSRKFHPDLNPNSPDAHDKMVSVNRAVDQLRLVVGIR